MSHSIPLPPTPEPVQGPGHEDDVTPSDRVDPGEFPPVELEDDEPEQGGPA